MIIELYILMQVAMLGIFFTAFFSKQEILWAVSLVLSGVLMISSYFVEIGAYSFDISTGAYVYQLVTHSFPFMMGINMLFFSLSLLLGMFDLFDKYGISIGDIKVKV